MGGKEGGNVETETSRRKEGCSEESCCEEGSRQESGGEEDGEGSYTERNGNGRSVGGVCLTSLPPLT